MIDATNFTNQLHVIELLAKNVPANHKLYVKEHPYMIGQRPTGFNDNLAKIPNVKIIYPLSSTKDIIARASVVATITGTAGWERLMMGRPVLVIGECLFSNFPGVVRCTDPNQLASAFRTLIFETQSDADRKTNAHHILRSIEETAFDLKVPWEIFYRNLNKEGRGGLGNNPLVKSVTKKCPTK
jgi:capsule polysaccharide modification protein KpsS